MNRGYIKLFRKITDNEMFSSEPFDKFHAWVDLLLLANHKDGCIYRGMKKITVNRGQHHTSITKLAERWHWGERKVDDFLSLLQSEGMIYYEKSRGGAMCGTHITIVNYRVYQDFLNKNAEQNAEQITEQNAEHLQNKQQNTMQNRMQINNNVKNDIKNDIKNEPKNEKKPSADFFVEE